ncbi:MAG: hypothetical protein JSS81_18925 [Acidobacteria bacterium]|nr:hypothetical protein [Acidobacteriota bacterium]
MENLLMIPLFLALAAFPFGIIYLVLAAVGWSDRRNLFSDSWFVYLAWLLTAGVVYFGSLWFEAQFLYISGRTVALVTAAALLAADTLILGIVLWRRGCALTFEFRDLKAPTARRAFKTSALVGLLTLLMIAGLFVAVVDLNNRYGRTNDGVVFSE